VLQSGTYFHIELVIAEPLHACSPLTNGAYVFGNVALVERGFVLPSFTPCSITELIYHCTYQIKSSLFQATMAHSTETHMHIKHTHTHTHTKTDSSPADWRRQLGRPRITWLSTVQQDLKQHNLTLPKAADLAQNCPLWRMMSMYGATQS